jgi:hypothetical protein
MLHAFSALLTFFIESHQLFSYVIKHSLSVLAYVFILAISECSLNEQITILS